MEYELDLLMKRLQGFTKGKDFWGAFWTRTKITLKKLQKKWKKSDGL